ncbi:hypothetical protein F3Y22_tig00116984pilonHSYRG00292 [Hibiscus syriacus]|uniref:Uncharacterized protein n=1 Tax=Hibiscus syriacus TaxID=106335 RepID=A0A6A2XUH1_HIBSY|nr:hypothetical protein F3Y22_tig00116984pilonHSYRG00292 [Hibiscus syriacus]
MQVKRKNNTAHFSVMDFGQEEDDEDSFSSFNQSHAITQSVAKLEPVNLGKWMSLEEDEERALQLLNHVKETSSLTTSENISTDKLQQKSGSTEIRARQQNGAMGTKERLMLDRKERWAKFVEEPEEFWEIERAHAIRASFIRVVTGDNREKGSDFITVVLDHQAIDRTARDRALAFSHGDHFEALAVASL